MKLAAPISKVYEVEDAISAGADELYCGVYTEEWRKRYSDIAAPNRHSGRSASLKTFEELRSAVKLAHIHNAPIFFTINEFYFPGQYDSVLSNIEEAVDAGVDALIVVDINLLLMIKEKGHNVKIHMGTGATTFNSQTVDFYKVLGVSRVILDRQLSIEEIGFIASKSSGVELEVFGLNQRCHNIDGFCTFQHGLITIKHPFLSKAWNTKLAKNLTGLCAGNNSRLEKSIFKRELGCCLDYQISKEGDELEPEKRARLLRFFDTGNFLNRCGACALHRLNRFNIGLIKIVGREDFTAKKVKDIRFIRASIDLLKDNLEEGAYAEKVKQLYSETYSSDCSEKTCYYPA